MADIDLARIKETALRLAKNAEGLKPRHFLAGIEVGKEPRIKVLRGFRGVGKTTALLQLMGEGSAYFSMDNPYIEMFGLYGLGKAFALAGYKSLLVDEVHYYKNWKRDSKALYDEFPSLSLVLSGSAPLVFEPERRYEVIDVDPLSLREFAALQGKEIGKSEAWRSTDASIAFLAANPSLYELHNQYINGGAFPTYFTYKEKTLTSIYESIRKSIREDSVFLPNVSGEMVMAMERALNFLATSPLGEFSVNNLTGILEIKKHSAYYLVQVLESMRVLRLVRPYGRGAKLVRGEPKLMFYHPNMRKAVCGQLGMEADTGALREELAVFCLSKRGWRVNTIKGMKRSPDYIIERGAERFIVEIGGPSKTRAQLKGFEAKALLLEDRHLIMLGLF